VTAFKRKLCPYEKFLWFPDRTPTNFNVSIITEVEGHLNIDSLKDAISLVQSRHSLSSVSVKGKSNPYFKYEKNIPIPIRHVQLYSESDCKKEIEHELHTPFNLSKGPLIRFLIIEGKDSDKVIITGDHLIVDGIGLSSFLIEVLNITLTNQKLKMKRYPKRTLQTPIAERLKKNRKPYNKASLYQLDKTSISDAEEFAGQISKIDATGILSKYLSTTETEQIIKSSKANDVSVQSMLFSAAILAISEKIRKEQNILKPIPIQYECPVNLRPYLKKSRCSNQLHCSIGILNFNLEVHPNDTFWDLAVKTKQELQEAVMPGFEVNVVTQFSKISNSVKNFEDLRALRSWKGPTVGVSNLGVIGKNAHEKIKRLSVLGNLHGTFYSENNFYLVVATFKNSLAINFFYPKPLMSEQKASNLLDDICNTLVEESLQFTEEVSPKLPFFSLHS